MLAGCDGHDTRWPPPGSVDEHAGASRPNRSALSNPLGRLNASLCKLRVAPGPVRDKPLEPAEAMSTCDSNLDRGQSLW